ncbi:hypothetical protein MN01_00018 [Escherichia phage MN01]|nr:hypothetical protein MN01_00018 [Escherichia phage MN01]
MAQTIRLISANVSPAPEKYILNKMYNCEISLEFVSQIDKMAFYNNNIVDADGNKLTTGGINLTPREPNSPFKISGISFIVYKKKDMSYFIEFRDIDGTIHKVPLVNITADQIEDGNSTPKILTCANNSSGEEYLYTLSPYRMDAGAFNNMFVIDSVDFFEYSNKETPFHTELLPSVGTSYIIPKTDRRTAVYAVVNISDRDTGKKLINSFYSFSEIHPNKTGPTTLLSSLKYLVDSTGTELSIFPKISVTPPIPNLIFNHNLYTPIQRGVSLAPNNRLDQTINMYIDGSTTAAGAVVASDNASFLTRPASTSTTISMANLKNGTKLFLKDYDQKVIKELDFVDTEYIILPISNLKVKSMKPMDFTKPVWEYEFSPILPGISETEPYVVFESFVKETMKKLGDRFYASDLKGAIVPNSDSIDNMLSSNTAGIEYYWLHIWYPNLGKMYLLRNSNGDGPGVYPLIKTGKEQVTVSKTGEVIHGKNIELAATEFGFSEINAGKRTFQWYKDGVELPGQTTRALLITNLKGEDSGDYSVKVTATPSHSYAEDSIMEFSSTPFNINVDTTRTITAELTCTPMPIVMGQPFTLSGKISGGYGTTIEYVRLIKNSVILEDYPLDSMTTSTVIPNATLTSSGIYTLAVSYFDNGVKRLALSEPVKAFFADSKPLNLTCVLAGPDMANEGDDVLFNANVAVSSDASLTPVYTMHWYKDDIPVSDSSPDNLSLSITNAHYPEDEGVYYCIVSAHVEGYEPATIESNKIDLTILTDIRLVARLYSDNAIINKGDTTIIKIGFQADRPVNPTWKWHHKDGTLLQENGTELMVSPTSTTTYYAIAYPGYGEGIQKPTMTNEFTIEVIEPSVDADCDIYIHPLMPGRQGGFLWVGWWVIDEINQAIKDGFDWKADPTNSRFKYPCTIKAIVRAMNDFGGVEAQESRNGYILKDDYFNR